MSIKQPELSLDPRRLVATITLPWPLAALSPNARARDWRPHARAKKEYRAACHVQALREGAQSVAGLVAAEGEIEVQLRFVPPDRRRRDHDNLVASMKAGLDGVADALGVNDSRFRLRPPEVADGIGGWVVVQLSMPIKATEVIA